MTKLAIVTGASSGIGLELAKLAAQDGYDIIAAADTPLGEAEAVLKGLGVAVSSVDTDLSTFEGVDRLLDALGGRTPDILLANAGHGLGHAFLDQEPAEWRHVIDTNIVGTVYLLQKVLGAMVARGEGRVLVTGSIAGHLSGTFQAVYHGSKAFVDNFCDALHEELKDSAVTLTCLKPGVTDTNFFERADMEDTRVGQMSKDDPADVAQAGYKAMMNGERSEVYSFKNKLQVAVGNVLGGGVSAKMGRAMNAPGSGEE
jgi:short-subunit dehydrogenase